MTDPFLDYMEWRDMNANDASGETPEHYDAGTRQHAASNYEGAVFACGCGERFMEKSELQAHIIDEAEDVAPNVGYPELERESDSRLQQLLASAYAALVNRTLVTR